MPYTIVLQKQDGEYGFLHLKKANSNDYQYVIDSKIQYAACWTSWKQAFIFNQSFLEGKGLIRFVSTIRRPRTI